MGLWHWWRLGWAGGGRSPVSLGDVVEAAACSLGQGPAAMRCVGTGPGAGWWRWRSGQQHQLRASPGPEALGGPHHGLPQLLRPPCRHPRPAGVENAIMQEAG